ncbi:MAG TPA: VWA domain-containing protein [Gammaproteobacteria bacterium]|nr:VWA domain-containing protein [Gammaproteobacteria bacterium]
MEEQVGKLWHSFITGRTTIGYPQAAISFSELSQGLSTFYRAMGGDPAKNMGCTDKRRLRTRRAWLVRVAGTQRRFAMTWQDEKGVYFPERIDLFPQPELNKTLYFWLAAMAAQLPPRFNWFRDNQLVTRTLLDRYPGFREQYRTMAAALLAQRKNLVCKTEAEKHREKSIIHALNHPGDCTELPAAERDSHPVALWLYPAPPTQLTAQNSEQPSPQQNTAEQPAETVTIRKQAKRTDDSKKTDGLLVFIPDSLFSWTEHINMDRSEDETFDENAAFIAQDLDELTLGNRENGIASRLKIDLDLPSSDADDFPVGRGIRLPEWHYKRHSYIANYCLLQPLISAEAEPMQLPGHLKPVVKRLKSQLDSFRLGRNRLRRQPFGDEINLDAWLEHTTSTTQHATGQKFFNRIDQHHRDLSTLILADLSLSTEAAIDNDTRVIDVIRDSLLLFGEAIHTLGDNFALYGFSSVRNKMVRYHILKNFSENYDDTVRGRIQSIKPGFYTRLGTAIRQSTKILTQQHSEHKLLLIVSDGKPNDIDRYEGRYGIEDTRKAVQEAKSAGLTPFCITVDSDANDYLPYLFGNRGYSVIHNSLKLPQVLPEIYLGLTQ